MIDINQEKEIKEGEGEEKKKKNESIEIPTRRILGDKYAVDFSLVKMGIMYPYTAYCEYHSGPGQASLVMGPSAAKRGSSLRLP